MEANSHHDKELYNQIEEAYGKVTYSYTTQIIHAGRLYKKNKRLCEKISVNSTTVIKNEIASGLKNSRSIFLQYTINTVICQVSSTVSLLEWSVAE